jgi:hypothetical protein
MTLEKVHNGGRGVVDKLHCDVDPEEEQGRRRFASLLYRISIWVGLGGCWAGAGLLVSLVRLDSLSLSYFFSFLFLGLKLLLEFKFDLE